MKKLKSKLVTLAVIVALTGAFAPMQIVRADTGGQGTSDSQKKGTTSSSSSQQQQAAQALLELILRLLGW
jgi:hypothetical protein